MGIFARFQHIRQNASGRPAGGGPKCPPSPARTDADAHAVLHTCTGQVGSAIAPAIYDLIRMCSAQLLLCVSVCVCSSLGARSGRGGQLCNLCSNRPRRYGVIRGGDRITSGGKPSGKRMPTTVQW